MATQKAQFKYKASEPFWDYFNNVLTADQKAAVRERWKLFKEDPFHPSLGTHKINRLSSLRKNTVYSVVIENDLRVLFEIIDDTVFTIDIGTHKLYK